MTVELSLRPHPSLIIPPLPLVRKNLAPHAALRPNLVNLSSLSDPKRMVVEHGVLRGSLRHTPSKSRRVKAPAHAGFSSGESGLAMAEVLTPTQALDLFEYKWRDDLSAVNLVGEYEVDPELATSVLQAVGFLARKPKRVATLRQYPACVAVSMATFASTHYRGGALWSAVFERIEVEDDPETRAAMGSAFLTALRKLGLPTIEDGVAYLGPISFHAVIPDYCLRDVLVLLLQQQEQNPALDGQSFIAWASGRPRRLSNLDKPATRFLLKGGEFAVDLMDRLLDVLEGLRSGVTDVQELVDLSGAPRRLAKKAAELTQEGALELLRPARSGVRPTRVAALEGPHLRLDLDRASVVLRLPQLAGLNDDHARWEVLLDGALTPTHTGNHTSGSDGRTFEEAVLARPVRAVSAVLGGMQTFDLELVPSDEPLIAFDRSGHFITGTTPLPGEDVWLLYPESKGRPSCDGAELRPTIRLMGPIGWSGWVLDRAPLGRVRQVEFSNQVRPIHHRGRPSVVAPETLPGLVTRSGLHVSPSRPTVALPRLGTATSWHVEARAVSTGEVMTSDEWTCEAIATGEEPFAYADPFDGVTDPVLGEFDILVRGPLGTRVTMRVAVAEGLTQRTSVNCRSFVANGLTPVSVDWGSTTRLVVEPPRAEFGTKDLTALIRVQSADGSLALIAEPNHLEICRVVSGEATEWSAAALRLPSDTREDLGMLEVRMSTGQVLPPLTLIGDSGLQQILPPTGGAGSRQRYDLSRIADSLRSEKLARLQWSVGDEVTVLVTFPPDRLCSGAALDGVTLSLEDFAGVPDVEAGVYQAMAPWRDVVQVKVDVHGKAQLPEELAEAGPLAILARVEDPWAPAPWPSWPPRAALVEREGWPGSSDGAEAQAIRYLAGQARIPSDPRAFPFLWTAWERSNDLSRFSTPRTLARDITQQFSLDQKGAIESLLDTRLESSTALIMAMGAGLLAARPQLDLSSLTGLWRRFPALAATASTATVELPWDEITSVSGDVVEDLASGSDTWIPALGRFVHAPILNARSQQELEDMWREAQVIPAGLLDSDTRTAAAMALFRVRSKANLGDLCHAGPALAEAAGKLLNEAGLTHSAAWLSARGTKDRAWSWEILPQVSASLAAIARLAARGDIRAARVSEQFTTQWQNLARLVPETVEIDVVIAEMLARADTDTFRPLAGALEENE